MNQMWVGTTDFVWKRTPHWIFLNTTYTLTAGRKWVIRFYQHIVFRLLCNYNVGLLTGIYGDVDLPRLEIVCVRYASKLACLTQTECNWTNFGELVNIEKKGSCPYFQPVIHACWSYSIRLLTAYLSLPSCVPLVVSCRILHLIIFSILLGS